jgi:transcriptional regulator with XRE-family HTH domain
MVNALEELRIRAGLSIRKAAKRAGLSHTAVMQIEAGERRGRKAILALLSEYGVPKPSKTRLEKAGLCGACSGTGRPSMYKNQGKIRSKTQ